MTLSKNKLRQSPNFDDTHKGNTLKATPQLRRRYCSHILSSLLVALSLSSGDAFISFFDFQLRAASAMSTESSATPFHSTSQTEGGSTAEENLIIPVNSNNIEDNSKNGSAGSTGTPLLLPPDENGDANIPRLQLGDTISFQEMGPVIINADGSTRRIDNWDKMTKHEQEVAWRRIAKRNHQRREALLKEQQKKEAKD